MAHRKSTTTAAETEKATTPAQQDQVTLVGRLCADPVLRHTKSGKPVTTIRVAVNPPEGEATFHSVVVWNRSAEVVCEVDGSVVRATVSSRWASFSVLTQRNRSVSWSVTWQSHR